MYDTFKFSMQLLILSRAFFAEPLERFHLKQPSNERIRRGGLRYEDIIASVGDGMLKPFPFNSFMLTGGQ